MKKLLLVIAAVAMLLPSCKKINEALDSLDGRLDKLEQETIPSIDEQISAINTTLGNLDAMDKELKGYIDNLTTTASSLQEQINATNTKIEEVKTALQSEISTAKSEVLAQLATAKTELENELTQINSTIETLKAKDTELDNKIAELRSYVDTELGDTTDWVNATFATLEQYNALVSEVATIKEQIKAINQSITELETRLTTKINEDIATAASTLNADIQQKVKDITDAYTNAVKTAKEEITAAYTTAIQNAINALDSSLKSWVGEQLSNYYTIAEVNAKIEALEGAIAEGDATSQEELNKLKSQLETTATEITAAYKKAIEEAINTNNGVIDTEIANEIATVNQRITNEVATINAKIAEIESRLDNIEAKIADLLARIQSVSYIPTYDDGKATVKFAEGVSCTILDFEVSPKDAVAELAKVWQSAVSVKAIYTQTRTVSFIDMPIVKFKSDPVNGVISVTASGENLSAEFFNGTQSASVRLSISDGNNSVVSEYVPMIAKEVERDAVGIIPNNEIWYTATAKVEPYFPDEFGATITSNAWDSDSGKGIITFNANVTKIGHYAFSECKKLKTITIPDSVTSIGEGAFYDCTSLTSVTIPDIVISIGDKVFSNCKSLKSVTIPNSVTEIGNSAFSWCTSLTSITIGNSVTSIGEYAFYNCTSLTSITIPDSVTSIGYHAFDNCKSLTSVTIGDSVTSIGVLAFSYCKSLTSFYGKFASDDNRCLIVDGTLHSFASAGITSYTIPNSVTSIGEWAFDCTSLTSITIPDSVTSIGENAFSFCTLLTSITIGNSVTSIGEDAFFYCTSLTSVTIPNSVTSIGEDAFRECTSLKTVYCKPTTPPTGSATMFYSSASGRRIFVPASDDDSIINAYKAKSGWSNYADYIEEYDFE